MKRKNNRKVQDEEAPQDEAAQDKSSSKDQINSEESTVPRWSLAVLGLIVLIGVVIAAVSFFPDSSEQDPTVVIVNNERMHQSFIDKEYRKLGFLQASIPYQPFIDYLIAQRIAVQQAKMQGITIPPEDVLAEYDRLLEIQQLTRSAHRTMLIEQNLTEDDILSSIQVNELVRVLLRKVEDSVVVTDEEARKVYEQNKALSFTVDKAVEVSQIIVGDRETARVVSEKLNTLSSGSKGDAFAALAVQYSIDPSVNETKGRIGYVKRGMLPNPLEDVAFNLSTNTISDPIKTSLGWHILHVNSIKQNTTLTYDDIKPRLLANLLEQKKEKARKEYINFLKQQSTIEWVENT